MGDLRTTIHERLSEAYESMRTAHTDGDHFLVEARQAEIEDLRRIAVQHGIELPPSL
jgi:hypothetical protein